jgi:hypothetical protein
MAFPEPSMPYNALELDDVIFTDISPTGIEFDIDNGLGILTFWLDAPCNQMYVCVEKMLVGEN